MIHYFAAAVPRLGAYVMTQVRRGAVNWNQGRSREAAGSEYRATGQPFAQDAAYFSRVVLGTTANCGAQPAASGITWPSVIMVAPRLLVAGSAPVGAGTAGGSARPEPSLTVTTVTE